MNTIINEIDPGAADGEIVAAVSRRDLVNGEPAAPSLLSTSRPGRVFMTPLFNWACPENRLALESVKSQIDKAQAKRHEADSLLARRAAYPPDQAPPADLVNATATAGMLHEQANRLEAEGISRFMAMETALRSDLSVSAKAATAAVDAEILRLEKAICAATGWGMEQAHIILTSPVRQIGDPPSLARARGVCAGIEGQSQTLHDIRKAAAFRYRELTAPSPK